MRGEKRKREAGRTGEEDPFFRKVKGYVTKVGSEVTPLSSPPFLSFHPPTYTTAPNSPSTPPQLHGALVSSLIQYLQVSYSLSRGGTRASGGVWMAVYGPPPVFGETAV